MSQNHKYDNIETGCIHEARHKDQYGSIIPPIYQSSTFVFDNCEQGGNRFAGKEKGFIYSRIGNPTVSILEKKVAALEHAEACVATASGMGAVGSTLLTLLKAGDHIVSDSCLYGLSHVILSKHLPKFGIETTFIDGSIEGEFEKHTKENTVLYFFETPANPTLKLIDIAGVVAQAKKKEGITVVVDNTFSSPVLTKPITLGVDIVVHSATKYLNGHTDVVGGFVCGKEDTIKSIRAIGVKDLCGSVVSPHDAYLINRGLMTLAVRIKVASENAQKMAEFLHAHPKVKTVYFPGLPSHPGHDIAKKQMNGGFGSVLAFDLDGDIEMCKKVLDNLNLITLAVSLGGCESLIQHPASMTHAAIPKEEREKAGITDNLIRFSVGIENIDDLINDMKQALDKL